MPWQTAQIIADGLSTETKAYELQQDDALRERGVGIFANLSVAQIEAALATDPRHANPPAGWKSSSAYCLPDSAAESLNQAGQRVSHCLSRIVSQTKEDGQLHLVVAHGASIRHAARDLGIITSEEIPQLSMHYAVPVICEVRDDGWRRVAGAWKQRPAKNSSKQSVRHWINGTFTHRSVSLPQYEAGKWLKSEALPTGTQPWLEGNRASIRRRHAGLPKARQEISAVVKQRKWRWPKREIIFISDIHADGDALRSSLVAAGAVQLTGKTDHDMQLTARGKQARFIFGGDFFDKGPSNLRVLHVLKRLIDLGAKVRLLAGNHDLRVLYGMGTAGRTDDPRNGHFFARMGAKGLPFLQEIRDKYLQSDDAYEGIPDEDRCRELLLPQQIWWDQFAEFAAWVMSPAAAEREIAKIEKKVKNLPKHLAKAGITWREAYAAALRWRQLFIDKEGEFSWFYKKMRLAARRGSFLFVHAGLDDRTATMLRDHGTSHMNQLFQSQLFGSPFEFYFGPVANAVRTKYRQVDMPLSAMGQHQAERWHPCHRSRPPQPTPRPTPHHASGYPALRMRHHDGSCFAGQRGPQRHRCWCHHYPPRWLHPRHQQRLPPDQSLSAPIDNKLRSPHYGWRKKHLPSRINPRRRQHPCPTQSDHRQLQIRRTPFSEGSDEITLNPQGLLRLKVTASKEDGRNRFTLRVTWQDEESKTNRGRKLKIGKKG